MHDDHSDSDARLSQQTEDVFETVPETVEAYDEIDHVVPLDEASQPPDLVAQLHTGANWFYWIAALSVVNSLVIAFGAEWNFVVGLGITQVIDIVAMLVAQDLDPTAAMVLTGIALAISVTIAGMFAGMGYLANRAHTWVFIIGMLIYAGDGLLFLLFQEWLSVGFHAFALFGLFSGLKAAQQLKTYAVDQQFQLAPEAS